MKNTFYSALLINALVILMSCAPPTKMRVLIKMMPAQEEHFRKKVIPPFEKKYDVKVTVVTYDQASQLPQLIKASEAAGGLHLIKVPFEMTRVLVSKDLILSLDSIVQPEQIKALKNEYFLLDLVRMNRQYFYMPRKFETRMLLYLKSEVRDAIRSWSTYQKEINNVLKNHNGLGLPNNYQLEESPDEWDFYDIFVLGFYWKNRDIGGKMMPRIAHRAKKYGGTALRLVDRVYQLGGSSKDILRMEDESVTDMLMWETIYTHEGIYNPRMYEEGWSGADIWKGFKSGEVFLSFMTQIDAFFIHGVGTKEMPGFLKNPEDMGVAIMPKGVSLELENGIPVREGGRSITTGGWWWGIPKNTKHRQLSFELAHYITNTENQIEGCSGFGMVPVRQDILSELGLMFGGGWISEVFHVASQQLVENRFTVIPLVDEYDEIGENYIAAFYDICIKGSGLTDGKIDKAKIQKILETKYIPIQKSILKNKFPPAKQESKDQKPTLQKFKALNKDLE